MVILALFCLITFAFSLAALSLSKSQQRTVLSHGWNGVSNNTRTDIQNMGHCCGFDGNNTEYYNPPCDKVSMSLFKTHRDRYCTFLELSLHICPV